jgi:putative membrane protein
MMVAQREPPDVPFSGGEGDRRDEGRPEARSREKGSKQELAEERTDWAKERTLLAKQRTFAAWLRTGLASAGGGFAAAEFLGELEPRWMVLTASVLLVLSGGVIFVIGYFGYRDTFRKLRNEGVQGLHPWAIAGVTFTMLLGVLLLLYSLVI